MLTTLPRMKLEPSAQVEIGDIILSLHQSLLERGVERLMTDVQLAFLLRILLNKVVAKHLEYHLNTHTFHDNQQSDYHTGHPTEIALLNVHHDNECIAALVLSD